jgi:hypothetical protein
MITRNIILSNFYWLINSQIAIDVISLEFTQISSYLKLITLYLRKYLEEEDKLYDKIVDKFENLEKITFEEISNNHNIFSKEQIELINKHYNNDTINYSLNDLPVLDLYITLKLYTIFYDISLNKSNTNTYLPILVGLHLIYHLYPNNIIK